MGLAVTGVGSAGLFDLRDRLSTSQCLHAVQQITAAQSQLEPFAEMAHRDRVWELHAMGWHGRLHSTLSYAIGESYEGQYEDLFILEQARLELLKGELLVRAYIAERGRLPADWSEVTAVGLPNLARDPFDRGGGPLRYRRTADSYVLYSVGGSRVDEGGVKPAGKYDYDRQALSSGDLSLATLYAPDPAEGDAPPAASSEPTDAPASNGEPAPAP